MQGGRIFAYGARKNWWSRAGVPANMPVGEIGGPDSEVFYDFGLEHDGRFGKHCHPNCDCGRFIEIGNSVFMQFVKQAGGSFASLPKKNVDFGGGLERLTAATRNDPDVFLIDVFDAARAVLEERTGKRYGENIATTISFRIILDHMRAASFMLASGILPGNSEQGYVLRRLIRRAIREADKLGVKEAILADVAKGYGEAYREQYPFVLAQAEHIKDALEKEEARFRETLQRGLNIIHNYLAKGLFNMGPPDSTMYSAMNRINSEELFRLYTTHGFPVEQALEEFDAIRAQQPENEFLVYDRDQILKEFREKMMSHQNESRAGAAQKFAGGLADHSEQTVRYHTAHHLLLKALQKVLGPAVHQRGSNITAERLRIDFNYGAKMTDDQKKEVERIVNEKIDEALPVTRTVMPKDKAEKLGAEHEFGANYPETVSVYSVGPKDATEADPKFAEAFSIEFCGGPHVANTAELGEGGKRFKIQKEEASSAGVRRIKAVLA